MKTRVVNKRSYRTLPPEAVNIMRPTIYGNPYVIGKDGTREEVIAKFREYFNERINEWDFCIAVEKLEGKLLVCCCAPLPCHGDVYVEFLESRKPVADATIKPDVLIPFEPSIKGLGSPDVMFYEIRPNSIVVTAETKIEPPYQSIDRIQRFADASGISRSEAAAMVDRTIRSTDPFGRTRSFTEFPRQHSKSAPQDRNEHYRDTVHFAEAMFGFRGPFYDPNSRAIDVNATPVQDVPQLERDESC